MRVKRTKNLRYSFELSYSERQSIFSALSLYIDSESIAIRSVQMTNEDEVMRHLHYSVMTELLMRKEFKLHHHSPLRWILNRTEAIALMWLLRHYDTDLDLLELKSGLHKQLHS